MDEELTIIEQKLENEYKKNYIKNYSNLIIDNIVSIYSVLGNDHNITFKMICKMSLDTYNLSTQDLEFINKTINEQLRKKYKLKIISKDKNDKLIIDSIKH
jgi:hypothetical protein